MNEMAKVIVMGVGGVGSRTVSKMNDEQIEGMVVLKALGESAEKLETVMQDAAMIIVICDMDGTAEAEAALIAAKIARKQKILTVGIVTKSPQFEKRESMTNTLPGIDRFKESVDALVVIPDDSQLETVCVDSKFSGAMKKLDEKLLQAVQGITDLMKPVVGVVDLDFADVIDLMKDKGVTSVGIGKAKGAGKALEAAEIALTNPLTETAIEGASHIIINVSGDFTLMEVADVETYVCNAVGENAGIVIGAWYDEAMRDEMRVTVIATGFGSEL